jgi:hypothetical protein
MVLARLQTLIDQKMVVASGGCDEERLDKFELSYRYGQQTRFILPPSYRKFVQTFGDVAAANFSLHLLGLPGDLESVPTSGTVLASIRYEHFRFPPNLLPVERLPSNQVVCVETSESGDDLGIVAVDLDDPQYQKIPVAPSFYSFCSMWMDDLEGLEALWRHADRQQAEVAAGRRFMGQASRPNDWRTYRLCTQDVLTCMVLLRHDRTKFTTRVGAFAVADLTAAAPQAAVQSGLAYILSDAYRSGGDLSLTFQHGEGRRAKDDPRPMARAVPERIQIFARREGIPLPKARYGRIASNEAAKLYLAAINCPPGVSEILAADERKPLEMASVCYAMASGHWQPTAVEYVLRNAHDPIRVLRGKSRPLDGIR